MCHVRLESSGTPRLQCVRALDFSTQCCRREAKEVGHRHVVDPLIVAEAWGKNCWSDDAAINLGVVDGGAGPSSGWVTPALRSISQPTA